IGSARMMSQGLVKWPGISEERPLKTVGQADLVHVSGGDISLRSAHHSRKLIRFNVSPERNLRAPGCFGQSARHPGIPPHARTVKKNVGAPIEPKPEAPVEGDPTDRGAIGTLNIRARRLPGRQLSFEPAPV